MEDVLRLSASMGPKVAIALEMSASDISSFCSSPDDGSGRNESIALFSPSGRESLGGSLFRGLCLFFGRDCFSQSAGSFGGAVGGAVGGAMPIIKVRCFDLGLDLDLALAFGFTFLCLGTAMGALLRDLLGEACSRLSIPTVIEPFTGIALIYFFFRTA